MKLSLNKYLLGAPWAQPSALSPTVLRPTANSTQSPLPVPNSPLPPFPALLHSLSRTAAPTLSSLPAMGRELEPWEGCYSVSRQTSVLSANQLLSLTQVTIPLSLHLLENSGIVFTFQTVVGNKIIHGRLPAQCPAHHSHSAVTVMYSGPPRPAGLHGFEDAAHLEQ